MKKDGLETTPLSRAKWWGPWYTSHRPLLPKGHDWHSWHSHKGIVAASRWAGTDAFRDNLRETPVVFDSTIYIKMHVIAGLDLAWCLPQKREKGSCLLRRMRTFMTTTFSSLMKRWLSWSRSENSQSARYQKAEADWMLYATKSNLDPFLGKSKIFDA